MSEFIFYYLNFEIRVCFLINKRLVLSQYMMKYSREKVIILTLNTNNQIINIINMYFKSSESKQNSMSESLIHKLLTLLDHSEEVIFINNFNVHNSLWEENKVIRNFIHSLSHTLLHNLSTFNIRINNQKKTITYDESEDRNFINLITTTKKIHDVIKEWKVWEEINLKFDHKLIWIKLNIEISSKISKHVRK